MAYTDDRASGPAQRITFGWSWEHPPHLSRSRRKPARRWLPTSSAVLAALLSAGGCSTRTICVQAGADAPDRTSRQRFPIRIGAYGAPYVNVTINGRQVELMLDTGNLTGLSLSPATARRLKLPRVGEWTSYDSDGQVRGRFPVVRAERVGILGATFTDQKCHVLESDRIPGLVGPRYLLNRRFTIDYAAGRIDVADDAPSDEPAGGDALPLIAVARLPGMIVVEGSINERRVLVQLDTGKSRTCIDPSLVTELGLAVDDRGVPIAQLTLGTRTFAVASAKVVGFSGISAGLGEPILVGVGSDVLSQFAWTVDYPAERFLRWHDVRSAHTPCQPARFAAAPKVQTPRGLKPAARLQTPRGLKPAARWWRIIAHGDIESPMTETRSRP